MPCFKIPTGVKIFALIWLLILVLPITREVFQAYFYTQYFTNPLRANLVSTNEEIAERLHQQHPDSIEMALWYSGLMYWRQGNNRTIADLDALRKKYPRNLQIPAFEIQLISNEVQAYRNTIKIPAYKAKLMEKAAKIAFESGQKQPQNVFWPMMESGLYTFADQKSQALEALKRLNQCTFYDDFSSQILSERMQFIERHENIIWEQKIAIWASMLYPHLSVSRVTCNAATDEAVSAKKLRNNEHALEILAPMLKGLGIASRDSHVYIGSLVAENRAYESLKVLFDRRETRSTSTYDGRAALRKELIQSWIQFSNDNDHPELATLAEFIDPEQSKSRQYFYRSGLEDSVGLRPPWGTITFTSIPNLFWISVLSLVCGFIWSFNALVFRHDDENSQPVRGQITSSVLFSFWALCGLVVIAYYLKWLLSDNFFNSYSNQSTPFFPMILPILIVGIWLLPVYYQSQRRKVWRIKTHPLFEEPDSLKTRLMRLVLWGSFLLCFILAILQLPWEAQRADLFLWVILGIISFLGAVFNEVRANNANFAFGRKLASQSAGVFAILWGLIFVFGSVGLWPLRAELNKQWERRLSMSEVDWTKEQYEKNK